MEKQMIHQRISEVMEAVDAISKDRKNVQQNYNFRGIDDMYNVLNPHLAKAKIYFTSNILSKEREERETKAGNNLIYTVLLVRWTAHAEDGSSVDTDTVGEAMDSGDKSANKAMSASYKYALMQLFCIPTEDPKDTENETHDVKAKNSTQPNTTPPIDPRTRCAKCGAGMTTSKTTGKLYCVDKCWLKPMPITPPNSPPEVEIDITDLPF